MPGPRPHMSLQTAAQDRAEETGQWTIMERQHHFTPRCASSSAARGACTLRRHHGWPAVLAGLFFALAATSLPAGDFILAAGTAITNNESHSSAAALEYVTNPWPWRGLDIAADFGITRVGAVRHRSSDFQHDVWVTAGGLRATSPRRGLFASFQVGYAAEETPAISTHYQFITTAGWQGRRFDVMLRHISNGSTGGHNLGETMILAGFHFGVGRTAATGEN